MTQPTPEHLRLYAKMDLSDLAERARVSDVTISNIERGRVKIPAADTLDKIATALGIPMQEYVNAALSVRKARR